MALRTSLPLRPFLGARAFHTAPVVRQIPAVPPPARRTAAELGFNGNQDRTRTLDPALTKPLEVSDSSYLHLPKESQLIGTDRREQHLARKEKMRKRKESAVARTGGRDFAAIARREEKESEADFFAGSDLPVRARGKNLEQVDMSLTDLAHLAGPAGRQGRGQGRKNTAESSRGGKGRGSKDSREKTRSASPVPRRVAVPEVYDQSEAALFGKKSLLMPALRGAREPESSFWAQDMDAAAARKADALRLAGSYDIFIPTAPHPATLGPSSSPAERAKSIAAWTVGLNPSVGLRRSKPAEDVFKSFLG